MSPPRCSLEVCRVERHHSIRAGLDPLEVQRRRGQLAGLDEGEALSFLFENFNSVIDEENLTARLRLFNAELDGRKR